ncbi:hypothetical protein [Fischerella sp. PCC 9605]|uniref:hypothetical protein n=1 Tax=Fischerella sp. PCC 9605 TaxID=1173024 RepID=UPI0004AE9321|nr:hypothetical protein [Fischerella sp. PCC 9605]
MNEADAPDAVIIESCKFQNHPTIMQRQFSLCLCKAHCKYKQSAIALRYITICGNPLEKWYKNSRGTW